MARSKKKKSPASKTSKSLQPSSTPESKLTKSSEPSNEKKMPKKSSQSSSVQAAQDKRQHFWWWCGLAGLLFLVGWVFWGSLGGEALNWDDTKYFDVRENDALKVGWSGLWAAWSTTFDRSWYPVLRSWFWLAAQFASWWKVSLVQIIKAGNVVLTLLGAGLFFRVMVRRVGAHPLLALILVGAVWLHPLRIESFAWASNARDTLSLFFLLWSLDLYLRGSRTWLVLALLASLSKTSVVLVPLCFPLVAGLLKETPWGKVQLQKNVRVGVVSWTLVALALLGVGGLLYKEVAEQNCRLDDSIIGHLGAVACVQARYLARIFSIQPPVAIPVLPWSCGLGWIQVVCFVGWAGLGILALWFREGMGRWFSTMTAWWLCSMLPIAGVIPIAFPIADRYTLLPMVGIALLLGAALAPRWQNPLSFGMWFALSCVVGMGIYTQRAVPIWQSNATLWSYNARSVPNEWAVHLNLGGGAGSKGDFRKARAALERAWLLAPHRYLVLQSLFLARAVVLEPKMGVALHRAFIFARNDREKLKQMMLSPYVYRHAALNNLIRFRIKELDHPLSPQKACREERDIRWRLHPERPNRPKK